MGHIEAGISYEVCVYCKHSVWANSADGYGVDEGCNNVVDKKGRFARITHCFVANKIKQEGGQAFCGWLGCQNFEKSGLEINPEVKKELVKVNHRTKDIPESSTLLEDEPPYHFEDRYTEQAQKVEQNSIS
jgi:hypothetical protein